MSQTALADQLGVTFQQVQKYEKGVNQDCRCNDVSETFDWAPVRGILPERNMSANVIIIGGEFREDPPKVPFVDNDQMIGAFGAGRGEKEHQEGARRATTTPMIRKLKSGE